jgi:hypothetical protein
VPAPQPAAMPAPVAPPYVPPRVDSPRFDEINNRVEAGERSFPRVEAGPAHPVQTQTQAQPRPEPRPQYQQSVVRQQPIVDLKQRPESSMPPRDVWPQTTYQAPVQEVRKSEDTFHEAWNPAKNMGNLSIPDVHRERNVADDMPIPKPPVHLNLGPDPAQGQKAGAIEALIKNNAGLGSDQYFSNFSSNHNTAQQTPAKDAKENIIKGDVAFAAPQQFQSEQSSDVRPVQPQAAPERVVPVVSVPPIVPVAPTMPAAPKAPRTQAPRGHVPYRITPMEDKYFDEDPVAEAEKNAEAEEGMGPKISGNVVDLKN